MPINFLPNDPRAAGAGAIQMAASPTRPAGRVGFDQNGLPPQAIHPVGSPAFVAWQAREAALRALDTFEGIAGPLAGWRGNPAVRAIQLIPDGGQDLNAYYDRTSVTFFDFTLPAGRVFSGASTDVVAHEVGHAILDALRPDFWNANLLEVGAFHEGFGDVVAIMTALADQDQRRALVAADPNLANGNFVETTAEELSWAIGQIDPQHNAAAPRRGLNTFQWVLPTTLPSKGGPGVLINEIHSFGQLVSGVYYDLIREIYRAGQHTEAGLWSSCQTATRLLVGAVKSAPIRPRFLQSVGRTMLLNDRAAGGANETFIRNAYGAHGIGVSASTLLAPRAGLSAAANWAAAAPPSLSASMKRRLKAVMATPDAARMAMRNVEMAGRLLVEASAELDVDLSMVSERLQGVVARTPQPALVGNENGAVAILGAIETPGLVAAEVQDFVKTLVSRGQVLFPGERAPRKGRSGAGYLSSRTFPSHAVVKRGRQLVLERRAFVCGCCGRL